MKKTGFSLLLSFFFLLFLRYPAVVKDAARQGLSLWYQSVVPVLLPFLILSDCMTATDTVFWLLKPFFFLAKCIPVFNPWYFYAFFPGIFCGYPMGAKTVNDLILSGKITKKEGTFLLPLVNQANPMFLAGYLGVHIFHSEIPVSVIYGILYGIPFLSLLFLGTFFTIAVPSFRKSDISETSLLRTGFGAPLQKKNSMSLSMEHTIWNSFSIIVIIGIYMMLFCILTEILLFLFPVKELSPFLGFLEFSSGLSLIRESTVLSSSVKTALLFSLTSFGGLCTAMQTSGMIKESGLSLKTYLLQKALYALLIFLLVYSSSSVSS